MTWVVWFDDIGVEDVGRVGGKNASLGELYRTLRPEGVPVPNGFAVTADAYRHTLTEAGAWPKLRAILEDLDKTDVAGLARRGHEARELVYGSPLPDEIRTEILAAYRQLSDEYGPDLTMAVRSSATAEDLPTASFAGQHTSYLNIKGEESLLDAVRRCFSSLFTDRAISYRIDQGFDHLDIGLSVGVMKMVRSDLAASGVIFTLDTESGFRDVVLITGAYGLGENVVQGAIEPDEFYVHKPTFEQGHRAVLRRRLGDKHLKMVYAQARGGATTQNIPTPDSDRGRFCISDDDVLTLADYAVRVERHYSQLAGAATPMDLEWAKDGVDGALYLVQARPETVVSQWERNVLEEYLLRGDGDVLVTGRAIGTKIATGRVRVIPDVHHLPEFEPGEILVADTTTPDWEPVMKTAAAVVTNRGGRTCHAAIVARELGVPAVVGAHDATEKLEDQATVTVSCAEGDVGTVYAGEISFEVRIEDVAELSRPHTEMMVNLANPDLAFKTAALPTDGVGLARMEFIINEDIKAHPMALIHPERVDDPAELNRIEQLTKNHASPQEFFIQRLSEGVGTIAAAFYPKPVVVRMSDFKTNEYAALVGGRFFEPVEANPMLGFRGAARFTHPAYAEGFALECAAMRRVRDQMGLTNVILMIPFCRTVAEARRVLDSLAANGLARGTNGLEIYMMCEIPNNVVQIDEFAELFDGFSIGSNDLTQLVLGVDRDSDLVAFDFDERDSGVLTLIREAVEGARKHGRHSGICGQAPSDFPEVAEYLVTLGIDSMSLNPDSLLQTTMKVLEVEQSLSNDSSARGAPGVS